MVHERTSEYGKNILFPKRARSTWSFMAFLKEPMVWLLLVAALVYYLLGEAVDAIIAGSAVVPIGLIDVVIEFRTDKALERLEEMGATQVGVVRSGRRMRIPSDELVPGDRLVIEEGELIMADCAIVQASDLRIDESPLTGESTPVNKERDDYFTEEFFGNLGTVFAGTRVLGGSATCLVVKTGQSTFYGKIGRALAKTVPVRTKLQSDIDWVVKNFGIVAVALSISLFVLEMVLGRGLSEAILSAVSLAIAAIPEELPMVFTLFLSLGMLELARNNALVKKLPAVEALGSVDVICTDKTGTITTGRMTLTEVYTDARRTIMEFSRLPGARRFMLHLIMACEKEPFDYMEKAIFEALGGTGTLEELKQWELSREYAFDRREMYMSHIWSNDGSVISAKGAVESILFHCKMTEQRRADVMRTNEELGTEGARVIGLAHKVLSKIGSREENENDMEFDGLVCFYDPLREHIRDSITEAQNAGVRVVMLTGDHKTTAHAIAHKAGIQHEDVVEGRELARLSEDEFLTTISDNNIFCRVLPEQKLRIVEGLQRLGCSVAVTGDGINDAPALKKADIGIAMGQRGTEVAKEAASLVLLDDDFSTIVESIRNGRKIYGNVQKAFSYLISFHLPIFLSALIIPIMGLPLLLVPIAIVVLELVLHPVVSIVFEVQPADEGVMGRGPRKRDTPILERKQLARLLIVGCTIFLLSALAYTWSISVGYDEYRARSLGFTMMLMSQLISIPPELGKQRFELTPFRNRVYIGVAMVVILSYVAIMYVPSLASAIMIGALAPADWFVVVLGAIITVAVSEMSKPGRATGLGEAVSTPSSASRRSRRP